MAALEQNRSDRGYGESSRDPPNHESDPTRLAEPGLSSHGSLLTVRLDGRLSLTRRRGRASLTVSRILVGHSTARPVVP
eukprot:610395-Hanusia_phi.AAC.2